MEAPNPHSGHSHVRRFGTRRERCSRSLRRGAGGSKRMLGGQVWPLYTRFEVDMKFIEHP